MPGNPLFNILLSPTSGQPGETPGQPPAAVGVINAQQSVITFAGAPVAITIVWKVLGVAIPWVAAQKFIPIVLSLIVGMLIYWQSATPGAKKDQIIGFVFALINSFAIAATTLGIETAISP